MSNSPSTNTPVVAAQPQPSADATRARVPSIILLATVVGVFGAGVLLTALTSSVTAVSEPGVNLVDGHPFLIQKAGSWTGSELQGLTEIERQLLPPDTEGARRTYTDTNGDQLYCSVILAGHEVTSIHRPELCLPGQGWKIQGEHVETIAVPGAAHGKIGVMRMNATRSIPVEDGRIEQTRSIFVYWFIGKNRETPYHWQRIFWTARDRILHNTNHRWAYVLISVRIQDDPSQEANGESSKKAMNTAARFIRDIYPTLVKKGER